MLLQILALFFSEEGKWGGRLGRKQTLRVWWNTVPPWIFMHGTDYSR